MLKISISNNDFQYLLNETQISLPEYLIFILYSCPTDAFSIKSFSGYLLNNVALRTLLCQLQLRLIDTIYKNNIYKIIIMKKEYYSQNLEKLPPESICNKIRRLANHQPPLYHYDYSISNQTDDPLNDMAYIIRKEFGYAFRTKSCRTSTSKSCRTSSSTFRGTSSRLMYQNKSTNGIIVSKSSAFDIFKNDISIKNSKSKVLPVNV